MKLLEVRGRDPEEHNEESEEDDAHGEGARRDGASRAACVRLLLPSRALWRCKFCAREKLLQSADRLAIA